MKDKKVILLAAAFFLVCTSCGKHRAEEFLSAILEKDYAAIETYLKKGVLKDTKYMRDNPLAVAVSRGDIQAITLLLQYGAGPNFILDTGESLLQWAIKRENMLLVKFLIQKGADINYIDPNGHSVFSNAITFLPDEDLVFFIQNGVNLMERVIINGRPYSFFYYLIFKKQLKTANVLLANEEVVNDLLNDETLIVHLLWYWTKGSKEVADMLISKGYQLSRDLPLLQEAIPSYEAVKWLLDQGISPSKEYQNPIGLDTHADGTPLEIANSVLVNLSYPRGDNEIDDEDRRKIKMTKKIIELLEERIALENNNKYSE
jgi:hypothetical protein